MRTKVIKILISAFQIRFSCSIGKGLTSSASAACQGMLEDKKKDLLNLDIDKKLSYIGFNVCLYHVNSAN